MRITVFQSDKGDSLLLTGDDGRVLLADGGMRDSYTRHVAPTLGKMAEAGQAIDLVYVSHIDQDHIAGVLKLMDDIVAWRVYDFQMTSGNAGFPRPDVPRPPEVKAIWHNAFQDQVEDNTGEIEELLVANMKTFRFAMQSVGDAERYENLVTSKREALLLSHRVGAHQLKIPLNQEFGGRLMLVTDPPQALQLGGMRLHLIGPFEEDLDKLRKEWNQWLKQSQKTIREIREQARRDAETLDLDEGTLLHRSILALAEELGNRNLVTSPNLASLMLLVEENGKTVLLTGDGHADDILKGLDKAGKLDAQGRMHVDVLKVQHHGSEHNIHLKFCQAVTADHYVFCGNGAHENPDLGALRAIIDARLGTDEEEGVLADRRFKFWFNSSAKVTKADYREHMEQVEALIEDAAKQSQGKLKFRFLRRGSRFNIEV
jgi:beta-lactamase superfamily II metal-dependent hydrolase